MESVIMEPRDAPNFDELFDLLAIWDKTSGRSFLHPINAAYGRIWGVVRLDGEKPP